MAKKMQENSPHLPGVVICNVYEDEEWDRVDVFHPDCYKNASEPYGQLSNNQQAVN